jgi:hypothetical protein
MVGLAIGIGCSVVLSAIIATLWVRGIDNMKNNPDYKGFDLFDEEDKNEIL